MRRFGRAALALVDLAIGSLLYVKLREFTMIPFATYVANIEVIRRFARRVSGAVVECGTWKGGMAIGMVLATENKRKYHFFDSFAGLPLARDIDGDDALQWQAARDSPSYHDNCYANYEDLERLLNERLKEPGRVSMHRGLFQETVPAFAATQPKIAILRLDGDWYDSTMTCLTALYDCVQPGGLIILDDYHTWDGCARAAHDFLSRRDARSRIHQSLIGRFAYIVKRPEPL